jgi:predicted small metal-binding protein
MEQSKFGNNVSNWKTQEKERALMAKTYTCRDVGVPCDWKVRAETEDEIMRKIRDHARTAHNMNEIPKDLAAKVKAAIHDEK